MTDRLYESELETPGLELVYRTSVQVDVPIELGSFVDGNRRIIPIRGEGRIRGPQVWGRLLVDAFDFQLTRPDGVTIVDARYAIQTDDDVIIHVQNRGFRRGPADLQQRIAAGEEIDPSSYYFRTVPEFTAPAGPYEWLNQSIFVCTGARAASEVRLAVFRVM